MIDVWPLTALEWWAGVNDHSFIYLLLLLASFANSIVYQGRTGASVGKKAMGLRLVWVPNYKKSHSWWLVRPGVIRCFFRFWLHWLDYGLFFAGCWKTLVSPYSQTIADSMLNCVVVWDDRYLDLDKQEVFRNSTQKERITGR